MVEGVNTKHVGENSEAQVLAAYMRAGKVVLLPFGDNQRFDLVVYGDGDFVRVQVKTGRLKNGVIYTDPSSSYNHRGRTKRGYTGEADVFAVYCPETNGVYVVPVDEAGKRGISLRVDPARNGQVLGVRYAKDFALGAK